jgi:diaminopimelate epimerase
MDRIEFVKLSGSGNDFVCLDNRDGRFDGLLANAARIGAFASQLCRRGLGVSADGVVFACRGEFEGPWHIAARFFEPDGSEAELCGNGTACFARWAIDSGFSPPGEIKILTPAGVVRGRQVDGSYIRVCIPLPENPQRDIDLTVHGVPCRCDFAVTGVPHLVTFVADVAAVDVHETGKALRWHPRFQPRGVNVNFAQVLGAGRLAVRTFEFGVEAETLACGTGAATAAVMAATRFGWSGGLTRGDEPILVEARGGDTLRVFVTLGLQQEVTDLCLDTTVRYIYSGVLADEFAARALGADGV